MGTGTNGYYPGMGGFGGINSDMLFNGKSLKLKDLEQTTVKSQGKHSSEIERITAQNVRMKKRIDYLEQENDILKQERTQLQTKHMEMINYFHHVAQE